MRGTELRVDLSAIQQNVQNLKALASPAMFCCVVKADAEGHGITQASHAAIKGGADWLGVALIEEAIELRKAGVKVPILMFSEPNEAGMVEAIKNKVRPTLYTQEGLISFLKAVSSTRSSLNPYPVHLKLDTGMHRVGGSSEQILSLARIIINKTTENIYKDAKGEIDERTINKALGKIVLESVWTHLAVSDDPDNSYNKEQLDKYDETLGVLKAEGWTSGIRHVVNSGGLTILNTSESFIHSLDHDVCYDMVRVGLSIYGIHRPVANYPNGALEASSSSSQQNLSKQNTDQQNTSVDLTPAMSLVSEVSLCKKMPAGSSLSYGLRHTFEKDTQVVAIPIGYADGLSREYGFSGGEVLIGGVRHRIVGAITMDWIMVECNSDVKLDIKKGDEVVLIGKQGQEEISVIEIAEKLNTIPDEIMCGIGKRVPRRYIWSQNV